MLNKRILGELAEIVGPHQVLTSPEDMVAYSFDGTFTEHQPDAVVCPADTDQVSRIMRIANREGISVTPRGMGSGLAGGSIAFSGGLVLNLTRLNHILEIDTGNMVATTECGVITSELQAQVEAVGLFYPPDPSSIKHSTIGGNLACNAGGPRCLKYGVTGDYVLGLTVVLADGRVLHTGGKAIKNVTGYNLTQLFVGSEGTLGVITEALLRLQPKPRFIRTAMAAYPELDGAAKTVNEVLLAGIVPATMELMDDTTIATIEEYLHLGLPLDAAAILIMEADGGDEQTVLREIQQMAEIAQRNGAAKVTVAQTEVERGNLWRGRRSVSPSLARRAPNKLGEDISVPRGAIPEMICRIKEISRRNDLPIVVFGHAGDGNLHPNILFDRRDPQQLERVQRASAEVFQAAVDLGGTLTGEHGVGVLKLPYLEMAIGPLAIELEQSIKRALDPKGILNSGKKVPPESVSSGSK